jgi:hypothetical protein
MENKMLDSLLKGNFKAFKEDVTSALYSKIASRIEDAKSEIASGIFGEEKESSDVEYKERANHSDKDGYPEGKDDNGEDDQGGGEYLVDLKMIGGVDTELTNFRVIGASKEDVESRLNGFFGKGKFEIQNIKLSEEKGEEYKEKNWQKDAEKKKAEKKEKDEEQLKKQDNKSIWYKSEEKNESTVEEGCGGDFKKIATKAGAEYGSKEAGKRVAGSILNKILKKKVTEEVVNELSDRTRGNYIQGAAGDLSYQSMKSATLPYGSEEQKKASAKSAQRMVGIHKATEKFVTGNPPEVMAFQGYLKKIGTKAKKANSSPEDVDNIIKSTGKVKQLESVNNLQAIAKVAQSVEEGSAYPGDYDYKDGEKDTEYSTSHDSFSDAIEHAKKHALGSGYKHDPLEFDDIVNQGFIKPSDKKSHAFHVSLQHKDTGKEAINKIHSFQITGKGDGKFNLTQDIK